MRSLVDSDRPTGRWPGDLVPPDRGFTPRPPFAARRTPWAPTAPDRPGPHGGRPVHDAPRGGR